ncbi:MAG: M67 family metallopeptidase [Acidobacteria bacterium]|nr:M67 family metallopeptidase [Acidobacteriota bacterium]
MIRIATEHLSEIKRDAEAVYPHECCGLLIGRFEHDGRTRVVLKINPVKNSWPLEERQARMLISPADYLRAEKEFSAEGLGVVGDYHSHPNHPAVPSRFDLEHAAWPTLSYIVVSVIDGRACELRSWEIAPDGSRFKEEEIVKGTRLCR